MKRKKGGVDTNQEKREIIDLGSGTNALFFNGILFFIFIICIIDLAFVTYLVWFSTPSGYDIAKDAPAKFLLVECVLIVFFITYTYVTIRNEITKNIKFYTVLVFTICLTFQFFVLFIRIKMSGYGVDYNSLSVFDNTCKGIGEQNCPVVRHLYENGIDHLSEDQCNEGFYFNQACRAKFIPSNAKDYSATALEKFVRKDKCDALQLQYSFTDTSWCYYWACSEKCNNTRNNVIYGGYICGIILFFLYLLFYIKYVTSIKVSDKLPR